MRTAIVTNMYPDEDAPYFGTFVKETVSFFGDKPSVHYPGNRMRKKIIRFYFSVYSSAVKSIFCNEKIVIHYPLFFVPISILCWIVRRRLVLVYHGGEIMERPWGGVCFNFFRRVAFAINNLCADSILVPTESVRGEYFHNCKHKTVVWYSGGIELEAFDKPKHIEYDLAFIGRKSGEKGFDSFELALDQLVVKGVCCKVAIVCREITEPTVEYRGALSVFWRPSIPKQDIKGFMRSCRCLVIPSRAESLCLVALEGASVGCRIVARDLPPIKEILGELPYYFSEDTELGEVIISALQEEQAIVAKLEKLLILKASNYSRIEVYERLKKQH